MVRHPEAASNITASRCRVTDHAGARDCHRSLLDGAGENRYTVAVFCSYLFDSACEEPLRVAVLLFGVSPPAALSDGVCARWFHADVQVPIKVRPPAAEVAVAD
jgi:hypothetical protein